MKINIKELLKKDWFWLAGIVAAALGLRVWIMSFLTSFTFDEIVSFSAAAKPLGQIWSYVKWEMHPPLHYYFLHFWLQIFGATEISAHISSIFLSLLAVIALYFLGKEIFKSGRIGLAAAALYSFSPLFCFYGVWARMYTLLFLTATLSFLFFFRLLKSSDKKNILNAIFFTIFTLAALFSHLTAGLVIAIEAVYLIYLLLSKQSKDKELLKKFFIPALIIFLAYGFWFWYFCQHRLKGLSGSAWYFSSQGDKSFWFAAIYNCGYDSLHYLTPISGYLFNVLSSLLLIILVFFAFAKISWKNGEKIKLRFFLSNGIIFSLLIFLLSFAGLAAAKLFVLRYAIIPAIGLFLIMSYGFYRADRSWKIVIIGLYFILSILSFKNFIRPDINLEDWRGVASFINQNERPGDKIVSSLYFGLLPLDFYYHGQLPAMAPLDKKYYGDDLLLTAIKTNMYPTTDQNNISQLTDFIKGDGRVFLIIFDAGGFYSEIAKTSEDWLAVQGFVATKKLSASGSGYSVVLMEKANFK